MRKLETLFAVSCCVLAAGVTSFLVQHVKVPREKVKLEDPIEKPAPIKAKAEPPPPNIKTVPDPTPEAGLVEPQPIRPAISARNRIASPPPQRWVSPHADVDEFYQPVCKPPTILCGL